MYFVYLILMQLLFYNVQVVFLNFKGHFLKIMEIHTAH